MSWPGPMGLCSLCYIGGLKHKRTCRECNGPITYRSDSGGDWQNPCPTCDRFTEYTAECPEPDQEDRDRWLGGAYLISKDDHGAWQMLEKHPRERKYAELADIWYENRHKHEGRV